MLTDTECKLAKPGMRPVSVGGRLSFENAVPVSGSYKLTDGNGLYIEIKPNGKKYWRYRFEMPSGGKACESVFTIGEYFNDKRAGHVSLQEARSERDRARVLVKQGVSPVRDRELEKLKRSQQAANTFEAVAQEWLALQDWKVLTRDRRLDMLQRVVFPKVGELPIRDITPAHVLDVIQRAAKHNGPSVAAEAKRTISCVFELAISTLRAEADPTYPVRKAVPKAKTKHKKALSVAEIGQLMRDVSNYGGKHETIVAFRLMWLTLVRPNEIAGARWSEFSINAGIWHIPDDRMKMGASHAVPLPYQAVDLLRGLHAITGKHEYLFPNRDDKTQPMSTRSLGAMIKALGWGGKHSPHAARTTGSTRLNELRFPADWIERQLAHAEKDKVRGTYNHAEYLPDRAKMMQQWADLLDAWQQQESNVTPIRKQTVK